MSHAEQIEALKGMLERVRRVTGPDRALDVRILAQLQQPGEWSGSDIEYACADPDRTCDPPRYTASVDAALALMDRVLPGAMWAAGCMEGGPFCRLVYPTGVDNGWGHTVSMEQEGGPPTEPLAILSALLSAKLGLLSQEEGR